MKKKLKKPRIRIPIPKPDRPHTTKKGKKGYIRKQKHKRKIDEEDK